MLKSLVTGLCLAVFAAVIIGLSHVLGLDLEHVSLIGVSLGAVLVLVPHRPGWGKVAGFLAGFLLAWIGFALRAAVLPDSSGGRAVAAFLVIALIAVVATASGGRLPLWSGLVGAAAIVGAYESAYTDAPSQFMSESLVAATSMLLAVGLGYLAATLVVLQQDATESAGQHRPNRARSSNFEPNTKLDDLVTGAGE